MGRRDRPGGGPQTIREVVKHRSVDQRGTHMQPAQSIETEVSDGGLDHAYGHAVGETLCREHAAMARRLGVLQQRLGDQLVEQHERLNRLERDNVRLRAELVRTRTAVLWGLHMAAVTTPRRRAAAAAQRASLPVEREWDAAQAVICQTGCSGHGHPWLEEGGHCRRTGPACHPLEKATEGLGAIDPPR